VNIIDRRILAAEILPYEEELAKYRETKIEPLHDLYRLSDHESFRDFERRKGEVLHSSEFVLRVQNINPALYLHHQINFESDWGFYADIRGKLVYLSGFPKGWMTEFSYALIDQRNLPTEERRGWRTVLLRMLSKGMLSWEQVVSEFGDSEGFNSERWAVYTAPYRNSDYGQVIARNVANEFQEA
jgi:hypothetical protein